MFQKNISVVIPTLALLLINVPVFAQTSEAAKPLAIVTHIDAMPQFTAAAVTCLKNYGGDSMKEAGAKKVDVLQQVGRPNHFTLYEIWADQKAYDDHVRAPHTVKFRADMAEMLGAPFDERPHRVLEN